MLPRGTRETKRTAKPFAFAKGPLLRSWFEPNFNFVQDKVVTICATVVVAGVV